jgi:hypothetical protein
MVGVDSSDVSGRCVVVREMDGTMKKRGFYMCTRMMEIGRWRLAYRLV